MRQRRYDDALQEVVPRDEWAKFWAEKVERERKRLADNPAPIHVATEPSPAPPAPKIPTTPKHQESPQAALLRVLKCGQLADAMRILQQWGALSRFSWPLHLARGGLGAQEELNQVRLDDQKIQALRDVFSCEQINDKSKVDWAILVCEADASSPAADALARLVNLISGLGLTCEGSLRYLHTSIHQT